MPVSGKFKPPKKKDRNHDLGTLRNVAQIMLWFSRLFLFCILSLLLIGKCVLVLDDLLFFIVHYLVHHIELLLGSWWLHHHMHWRWR